MNVLALLFAVHLLSAVIWVGGMFFSHMVLRPVLSPQEMERKVPMWGEVLKRFFPVVWFTVILLPVTGYAMAWGFFNGPLHSGWHVLVMQIIGWGMIGNFLRVYFRPYRRMKYMLKELLIPEAGLYLERIRIAMSINLFLGLLLVTATAVGRFG
ncbi:MAG: CopD family protein [Magnetococcales bacterium]|nr:CopD family protein [Magnetococcales bacterium]